MLIKPVSGTVSNETSQALSRRLSAETEGEVLFDDGARGRYATDASIYQIMPVGVLVPRTDRDVAIAIDIARDLKVPVLPRGAGTSQCGQTVGAALVIDNSKYRRAILDVDTENRTAKVEPGLVLDHLNAALKKHGLVASGGCLHQRPGDLGRHGGQQQLRLALHRLWQHGAQCGGRHRLAVGRHRGGVRPGRRLERSRGADRRFRARSCGAQPGRDRGPLAQSAAAGGGL